MASTRTHTPKISPGDNGNYDDDPGPEPPDWHPDNPNPIAPHRPPPHDPDTETALIGAALLTPTAIDAARPHLDGPDDFYTPHWRDTWTAIVALHAGGHPVDPLTVTNQLGRTLRTPDGQHALTRAQADCPHSGSAARYATIVGRYARLRRLGDAGSLLHAAAWSDDDHGVDRALARIGDIGTHDTTTSTWAPVDIAAVLDHTGGPAVPTMLHRDDGQALIYPAKAHAFNAESESGKSWLALWACLEQIEAGQPVTYIDFEDSAETVTERLLALGATRANLLERFTYLRPDDPARPGDLTPIINTAPALVVLDGVTEAMVMHGWSISDNDDAARFVGQLIRPFTRNGTAVLVIDHVTKDRDTRGRNAIGAQHKMAGIDVAYGLEVTKPFAVGLDGEARITVTKDRPGRVRPHCAGAKTVGTLNVGSTGDTVTLTITLATTERGGFEGPTNCMDAIVTWFRANPSDELSASAVALKVTAAGHSFHRRTVLTALEMLRADDRLNHRKGPRNADLYSLPDLPRQEQF